MKVSIRLLLLMVGLCLPLIILSQTATLGTADNTPPTCGDLSDGSITITGSGGSGGYEYRINGGAWQGSGTFADLGNGDFTVEVQDLVDTIGCSGCVYTVNFAIPTRPLVGDPTPTMPTNSCLADGMVALAISGGVSPQVNFNGMGFTASTTYGMLNQEVAYAYQVQNADGTCLTTGFSVTLEGLPTVMVTAGTEFIKPTDCMVDDGMIIGESNVDPAINPVEYSIDGGATWQTDPVFKDLSPDLYSIEVRNAGLEGCPSNVITDSIIYRKYPNIDSIRLTDPTDWCTKDGMILIYGSAGEEDPTYQYTIDGGDTWQTEFEYLDLVEGEFPIMLANYDTSCIIDSGIYEMVEPIMPNLLGINTIDPSDCYSSDGKIILLFEDQDGDPYGYSIQDSSYSYNNPYPPITEVVLDTPFSYNTLDSAQGPVKYWTDEGRELDFTETGTGVKVVEFFGLPHGTYELSYRRDTNVCITAPDTINLYDPPKPSIGVSSDPPIPCIRQTGSITINGGGGKNDYEYSVDGGSSWGTNNSFTNLPPGTYNTLVRNYDSTCPNNTAGTVTFQPVNLEPELTDFTFTHPTDCGAADGTISITAIPGSSTPQYSLNGSSWQTSPDFTGLVQGSYTPMVRNSIPDGNGNYCVVNTTAVQLMDPPSPSFPAIASANPDNGCDASGSLTINSTGGRTPLLYSIDGGMSYQNSPIFNNLNNDTYAIYVKNFDGTCIRGPLSQTLTGPVIPIVDSVQVIHPSDCDLSDGRIVVHAQGGVPFEYSFDNGQSWQTSNFIGGLEESDGVKHVKVRSQGGGCVTIDAGMHRVTDHIYPQLTGNPAIEIDNINKCGEDNGRIQMNVTGGDFDRVFYPPSNTPTNTNSVSGVAVATSFGFYQFSIDNGTTWQSSSLFSDLPPGTYLPVYRNYNGTCIVKDAPIQITEPERPSGVIENINSANCGASDGSFDFRITHGVSPIRARIEETGDDMTLQFNSLVQTSVISFSGLENHTTYTLIYGSLDETCDVEETIVLPGPDRPKINNVTIEHADCETEEGVIIVDATSESHSVQYQVDGGPWQNSSILNGLSPGTHQVNVRNSDGSCITADRPRVINQIFQRTLTVTENISPTDCGAQNGKITLQTETSVPFQSSIDGGLTWNNQKLNYINLDEGVYNVRIRNNDESCEKIHGDIILADPPAPEINFVYEQAPQNCMDNATIIIQPVVNSGSGNYEYSIDNGITWGTNNQFQNVQAGTYKPAIRNIENDGTRTCKVTANDITFTATSVPPVINSVTINHNTRCDINNGMITVNATSGNGPLQYSKDGGVSYQSSNIFTNLAGGNYDITVASNGNLCPVDFGTITINTAPTITFTQTVTQPIACVSNTGSVVINASGGSGNYSYSKDGGTSVTNGAGFPALAPGTYTLYVIDNTSYCTATATITINTVPNTPVLLENFASSPTDCNVNNGTITVGIEGSEDDYRFSIDNGATWQVGMSSFQNLGAGTYTIKATNLDASCSQTGETITLVSPPMPSLTVESVVQPTVCTYEKGKIILSATGGFGLPDFSIDGGITWQGNNPEFDDLEAGIYQPRVRNSDETCVTSLPDITINAAIPPVNYIGFYARQPLCLPDGEIHINASGGTGNLEYSIDNGNSWQIDSFFTGLVAGTYTLKVSDRGSICEADGTTLTLSDVCSCPDMVVNTTDLTSCTSEDAIIEVIATGGANQFPIEYSVDGVNWGNQSVFTNLMPNRVYRPSIRYANGSCLSQKDLIFRRPEIPLVATPTFSNPSCEASNGRITINTTGGEGTLEYSISGGTSWQSSPTFTELAEGTYSLVARNIGDECFSEVVDLFLDMPSQPQIDEVEVTQISDCGLSDGRIELKITNADRVLEYSYRSFGGVREWLNNPVFDNLDANSRQLYVRNVDGTCEADIYATLVTIEEVAQPIVQKVFPFHVTDCDGTDGRIQVQAAGGSGELEYRVVGGEWQDAVTISNLSAGTYQVQVRNKDGAACTVDYQAVTTLTEPVRPELDFLDAYTECGTAFGLIEVRAIGGETQNNYQYNLDNGPNWSNNGFLSAAAGSTHDVYIANGDRSCKYFVNTITVPEPRNVTFSLEDIEIFEASSCNPGNGRLEIVGMGRTSRADTISNEYEFRLNQESWQQAFDFNNLIPGNYTIEARTSTGVSCQTEALAFSIAPPRAPTIGMQIDDVSDCDLSDGRLLVNSTSNNVEFLIEGVTSVYSNAGIFSDLSAGTYILHYRRQNTGCDFTESITINQPVSPTFTSSSKIHPSDCSISQNGSIRVFAEEGSSALQYSLDGQNWQQSPDFNGLDNGTYAIYLRNANSTCAFKAVEEINLFRENNAISIPGVVGVFSPESCGNSNGSLTIKEPEVVGDYEYSIDGQNWQPNNTFSGLQAGSYPTQIRYADGGACPTLPRIISVRENPAPVANANNVVITDANCQQGGSVAINIANPENYEYYIGSDSNNRKSATEAFDNVPPGNYTVTIGNASNNPIARCFTSLGNFTILLDDDPSKTTVLSANICTGSSYNFNGEILTTTGLYRQDFDLGNDCDSTVFLDLIVSEQKQTTITETICPESSYFFAGVERTTSGNYSQTLTSQTGCDSIVYLDLTVLNYDIRNVTGSVCPGDPFIVDGRVYENPGFYSDLIRPENECPYIFRLNLQAAPQFTQNIVETFCGQSVFEFKGQTFTETGNYTVNIPSTTSCDSIFNLELVFQSVESATEARTICFGEITTFRGIDIGPGDYENLTTFNYEITEEGTGNICQYMFTLNLTILPENTSFEAETCSGIDYIWNGTSYNQSGNYIQTFSNTLGCDSTVTMSLDVSDILRENVEATICSESTYSFNGNMLNATGNYQAMFITDDGCDSLVMLDLTVLAPKHTSSFVELCAGEVYELGGNTYTETGTYEVFFTTTEGCDSIVELTLDVLAEATADLRVAICSGGTYVVGNNIYTTQGIYESIITSSNGCDSTITLDLTVSEQIVQEITQAICAGESYPFGGNTLTVSGVYEQTFTAQGGCDSIVTLNLEVMTAETNTIEEKLCNGQTYILGSRELATSGIYTEQFSNRNGCDSTVTLNLLLGETIENNLEATICAGESYEFAGINRTESGVYEQLLVAAGGCDSIIMLNLTVEPELIDMVELQICTGETYSFNDQILNESGVYEGNFISQNGCDSLVLLNLMVSDQMQTMLIDSICNGDIYEFGGQILETPGIYSQMLIAQAGCDSLVQLELKAQTVVPKMLDFEVCETEVITIDGNEFSGIGTYTFTKTVTDACDTLLTINLLAAPPIEGILDTLICEGESLQINGIDYTSTGTFTQMLQTAMGCDSMTIININPKPLPDMVGMTISEPTTCEATDGMLVLETGLVVEFSLNNSVWQTEPLFTDLNNGDYELRIRFVGSSCFNTQNIFIESADLPVVEDQLLMVPSACGESDGQITLVNPNGIYQYSLDDGITWQANPIFTDLAEGLYDVLIEDTEGLNCQTSINVSLTAEANDILVEATQIQAPTCEGDGDGTINISVQGGTPDYDFLWDSGANAMNLTNQPAGTYVLTVLDQNACIKETSFVIPEGFILESPLPADQKAFELCQGQEAEIDFVADPTSIYIWQGPDDFSSTEVNPILNIEGSYQLTVENADGCFVDDEVQLIFKDEEFKGNFVIPTTVEEDERFWAIEISWPIPDRYEWVLPEGHILHGEELNALDLSFPNEGNYIIGLRVYSGTCMEVIEKEIEVIPKPPLAPELATSRSQSLIKDFYLFPNPNDGQFTANVQLSETLPIHLRVYKDTGQPLAIAQKAGSDNYEVPFNLGNLEMGTYTLTLSVGGEWETLRFVVR